MENKNQKPDLVYNLVYKSGFLLQIELSCVIIVKKTLGCGFVSDLELLNRIKGRDREAFVELMRKYGASLYSRMLSKLGDRQLADAAFKETMVGFYKSLTENEGEDAISALLSGYADNVSDRMLGDYFEHMVENTANCVEGSELSKLKLPVPEAKAAAMPETDDYCDSSSLSTKSDETDSFSRGGWIFAVSLLSTCALIVIWIIVGLLVGVDVLPDIDFGYTWFNENIAEWF